MQTVEFSSEGLRVLAQMPERLPQTGFVWVYTERENLVQELPSLQALAQSLGGLALFDLHIKDLENAAHPSHYDYSSVYDVVVFRRLATQEELRAENASTSKTGGERLIGSRAVAFVIFDRLLISVHPPGCYSAASFVERFVSDHQTPADATRSRNPASPADLALRLINNMVDGYLELRRELSARVEHWQAQLLHPRSQFANWRSLMAARAQLHLLHDLCEEQHDALVEWQDSLRLQPPATLPGISSVQQDQLMARARDVLEHITRVQQHVRRLEVSTETAVQIHFSMQGNRTNDIMRTLTALTAIFLPLNLITGFFGMNFDALPLIHNRYGFWVATTAMALVALVLAVVFWHKRYLARTGR